MTLLSTDARTNVLLVYSLSPTADNGKDDDLGVSVDSSGVKYLKEFSELPRAHFLSQ